MRAACLILDALPSDMDAFDVLRDLKRRKCPEPLILVAGHATSEILRRAALAGVRHVVEKPLLGAALIDGVSDILR